MSQPKEVHCPFCHHKEMHDGPVGSTMRCRNCKSIFRMPAEGVTHGEKVKKYKVRRHSPIFYFILLVIIGAMVGAYFWKVKPYIEYRQRRMSEIWSKLADPFADRLPESLIAVAADSPKGTVARFMECWKQGKEKTADTGDYTGFESMLLYLSAEDLQSPDLKVIVEGLKDKFGGDGGGKIKTYSVSDQVVLPDPKDPTVLEMKVNLVAESMGVQEKHGELTVTLVQGKNDKRDLGAFIREHGPMGPDDTLPPPRDFWGVCLRKTSIMWVD